MTTENVKSNSESLTAQLSKVFKYDPYTGIFRWRVSRNTRTKAGTVTGNYTEGGYIRIRFQGKYHYAHRLAWAYVYGEWPQHELDHINQIKSDNRIANLRLATLSQNRTNIGIKINNYLGVRGVSRSGRKFMVRISHNHTTYYLGTYDTLEEAKVAHQTKAKELFGEFSGE